jgi:hypothetical protein
MRASPFRIGPATELSRPEEPDLLRKLLSGGCFPQGSQEVRVLDRRDFLKKAGLAPLALAVPGLGGVAWADDDDEDGHGWTFVALSAGATTPDGVAHTFIMNGCGRVDEDDVTGGGTFAHIDNAPTAPVPKPILATGTWEMRRLLSFNTIGTYGGHLVAGILEARIRLFPDGAPRVKATLKIVCNLGPAGILTGQPEGFFLTVDGSPPFGVFAPLSPNVGLTIFTPPEEDDD